MAKDLEELSVEELQRRLTQLRSLQERLDQGHLDINDRPLLLELLSNLIGEAERNGEESATLELLEAVPAVADRAGAVGGVEASTRNKARS